MIARRLRGSAAASLALVLVAAACSSAASKSSNSSNPPASPTASSAPAASSGSRPTAPTPAPACAPARPHASGQSSQAFAYLGVTRTYQLYVPPVYHGTTRVPLVFDFHGFGSNAIQQMAYGNFEPLANRDDFLVVAPDGQGDGALRHFNLSNEKGLQNDVAMTLALLTHIESTFCVDTRRVYSTGMSDGGAMTSVLACVAPDKFAAFGPVAVQIAPPGCTAHPVAMIAFHGTADPVVPYAGGKVNCCGGANVGSTPDAMARWAAHDNCATRFADARLGTEVSRRTWTSCDGTSDVVLYSIIGGGHTWPGSIPIPRLGMTTKQVDASSTIWAFFVAHPLSG